MEPFCAQTVLKSLECDKLWPVFNSKAKEERMYSIEEEHIFLQQFGNKMEIERFLV